MEFFRNERRFTMNNKVNEKEELEIFLKTLETERCICRGITRRKLFVVDSKKDRNIGVKQSL